MKRKKEKGMLTVEAAILLPVIFAVIFGIYYLSIMLFQSTAATTALMRTAARGAVYWEGLGGASPWSFQLDSGNTYYSQNPRLVLRSFTDHDPYRYFFDGKQTARIANIQALANSLHSFDPDLLALERAGTPIARKTGNILQKYVEVTVDKSYLNPISNLFARLGIAVDSRIQMTARAPLTNPGEFVRNASFIYDIVKGDDE